MTEIICTLITAVSGIIVAALSIQIRKSNEMAKEQREREKEQDDLQERQMLLLMQMVDTAISLSIINANAVMNYKNNGNVEEAYSAAREAKRQYKALMQEVTAHEVVK